MRNLYAPGRDLTPYGMTVEDTDTLADIMRTLERTSDYRARRTELAAFNAGSRLLKRGIALTPVKFGISFTLTHLNQAGALVHVYQDGSVHLNHGGTEMGQGLHVKVAQVVAEEFGIGIERVRITATSTGKVPNTSATAASAGSDLNGMAAKLAAEAIRRRMAAFAAAAHGVPETEVLFRDDRVFIGNESLGFGELARRCIEARVQLSEAGFYKTPKITWDRAKGRGRPFFYFAYGAACAEVVIDTLTGENRVTRIDILHDCGRSLNPAIDIGQIEGGFVQGMGWLTHRGAGLRRRRAAPDARAVDLQDPGRLRRSGGFPRRALPERQPGGDDLPLESRRRAAADAGDQRLFRHRRRDPCARARSAGSARRAGDAGGDPSRLRGGAREGDAVTVWRRLADIVARARRRRARDRPCRGRLDPAPRRHPHGRASRRRLPRLDRRRASSNGRRSRRRAGRSRKAKGRRGSSRRFSAPTLANAAAVA